METPRELVNRTLQEIEAQEPGSSQLGGRPAGAEVSAAEFPSEPFACPACGQLLAPTCRVCVACKRPIDPAQIARQREAPVPVVQAARAAQPPLAVRYPWRLFFGVLGASFLLVLIFQSLVGDQNAQLAMAGVQTLAGVWVFSDALRRRIPRPLRWGVGTMLLTVFIFPWYLARRRETKATVPFVEAEVGPATRFLLFALIIIMLASIIFSIVKNPPPTAPSTPVKGHQTVARGGTMNAFPLAATVRRSRSLFL